MSPVPLRTAKYHAVVWCCLLQLGLSPPMASFFTACFSRGLFNFCSNCSPESESFCELTRRGLERSPDKSRWFCAGNESAEGPR